MKKSVIAIIVIFFIGCTGQSQFISHPNQTEIQAGYLSALQNESSGLVENALFQIANNFLYLSNADFETFKPELLRLSREGATESIRKKARLVYDLIECPDRLVTAKIKAEYHNSEYFFNVLSKTISADLTLAGSKTK